MLDRSQAVTTEVPPRFKGRYIIRCIDQDFGLSKSSSNPMITLTWEIVGKEEGGKIVTELEQDGKKYNVAGIQSKLYLILKAGQQLGKVYDTRDKLGLEEANIDDETGNPLDYVGCVASSILNSEESVMREEQTQEQRDRGEQGKEILDDEGHKITYRRVQNPMILKKYSGELPVF